MRERTLLKKVICYGLSLAIWLQPQVVAATELVSLERAHPTFSEGKPIYVQRVASVAEGEALTLSFSDDLKTLKDSLYLYDHKQNKTLAVLKPTETGFDFQAYLPLIIREGKDTLPALRIISGNSVTLEADKLANPLAVQASDIILGRVIEVEQTLSLWAVGDRKGLETPRTDQEAIEQTLKGTGTVATQGLRGSGSLSLRAAKLHNAHSFQLKNISLVTSLYNTEMGDLAAEESLSVQGDVYNDGVLRSKLYLTEKGAKIHHSRQASVFSGVYHRVEAQEYHHFGRAYSGYLSHIQAERLWLSKGYQFQGRHFLAKATDSFLIDPVTFIEAQTYIELSNKNTLVTSGRLSATGFPFPYEKFFDLASSKAGLIKDEEIIKLSLAIRKAILAKKELRDICLSGIILSSDHTAVYQSGNVSTAASDILLKGHKVSHIGTSHSGTSSSASTIVRAKDAELGGVIKTSRALVTHLDGILKLTAEVSSPLTHITAASFDLSGSITGDLKALVEGEVQLQGYLTGEQAHIKAAKLVSTAESSTDVTHVVVEADQVKLGGEHKGKTLHVEGQSLTLGGQSAIDQVSAVATQTVTLSGTHTGESLIAKADQQITFVEGSKATLTQAAVLDAPDKQVAGDLKVKGLVTTGQTTHFTPSSQVDIETLQSEDQQKVTLDGQYQIQQAHLRAETLAIQRAGEIGQLDAVVKDFTLDAALKLTKESRVEATQSLVNRGQIIVDQRLDIIVPGHHVIGSIVGDGSTHIQADVANPEAYLFGKAGVQTKTGIHLTTNQPVTITDSHNVSHYVGLDAPHIDVKKDQHFGGGANIHSGGNLNAPDIAITSPATLNLSADGQLDLRNAQVATDILLMRSGRQGLFSSGTFSAPQMQVYTEGLCVTDGAAFISRGLTQSGEKAYQYFDVGGYTGQGAKQQTGRYLDGSTWQLTDEITKRVVHYSDGALSFRSRAGFDLTYAQLTASPTDTILISAVDDVRTKGVDFTAARAWTTSERGNIYEDGEVLTTRTHVNRSGCGGDYTYQTTSQRQQQTALANRYNLSGGKEVDASGRALPTFLYKVGDGKSIISQAVTIDAPGGLIMRIAPNGTIQQTTLTLVDTFNEHHQTWGRGYSNVFTQGSHHSREVGGQVSGRAELIDCLRNEEIGYSRAIRDYFHERAQHVTRRAATSHQSAYQSMQLQKDGDFFSGSGSVYQHQSMTAQMPVPVFNQVGHYIEDKPFTDQPATTTLEGPVMFAAKASSLVRDQLFKAMLQSMTMTSTTQSDNFSGFQPQQFSVPQFGSHPLSMLKGANQGIGYANQALSLIKAMQTGNVLSLALQIGGQLANVSSSSSEERMRNHETNEAVPFLDYGRAHFNNVSLQGVLAGLLMDSPTGKIPLFDVRAPRFERESTSESNQNTETVNPVSLSFGQSHSWSKQKRTEKGSQPTVAIIYGHPDLRIDQGKFDGVSLLTALARETQDFARITEQLSAGGSKRTITYLLPVSDPTGFTLIPRPQGKRVSVGKMEVIAPWYEQSFEQSSGHSSWNVNLGAAVISAATGNPMTAVMLAAANGINVGYGAEDRHEYHRGTQAVFLSANGAPITIEDLLTEGNVALGQGITANRHVHRDVEEIHHRDRFVDLGGQLLDGAFGAYSLYNGVNALASNFRDVFGSKVPIYSAQQRRALDDLLAPTAEEEKQQEVATKESSSSTARTTNRGSDPTDADPEPSPNPKAQTRGRPREKENRSSTRRPAPLVLDYLDQVAQEASQVSDFISLASDRAITQPSSPRSRYVQEQIDRMDINNGKPVSPKRRQRATDFWREKYADNQEQMQQAKDTTAALSIMLTGGAGLKMAAFLSAGFAGLEALDEQARSRSNSSASVLQHMAVEGLSVYAGGKFIGKIGGYTVTKASPFAQRLSDKFSQIKQSILLLSRDPNQSLILDSSATALYSWSLTQMFASSEIEKIMNDQPFLKDVNPKLQNWTILPGLQKWDEPTKLFFMKTILSAPETMGFISKVPNPTYNPFYNDHSEFWSPLRKLFSSALTQERGQTIGIGVDGENNYASVTRALSFLRQRYFG